MILKKLKTLRRKIRCKFNLWIMRLNKVHPTSLISLSKKISRNLEMGPYGYIGPNAEILQNVVMGKYVMIGAHFIVAGNDHNYQKPGLPIIFSGRPIPKDTIIEDDVWIGARVTIKSGIRISRGAVIAAGSVVVKDVNAYEVIGGIPALKIKDRFSDEHKKIHDKMLNKEPFESLYCD